MMCQMYDFFQGTKRENVWDSTQLLYSGEGSSVKLAL